MFHSGSFFDRKKRKRSAGYNYSTNTSLIPPGDTDPLKENTASSTYRIDYCGNYVYEKQGTMPPRLRRILTPEGYVQAWG